MISINLTSEMSELICSKFSSSKLFIHILSLLKTKEDSSDYKSSQHFYLKHSSDLISVVKFYEGINVLIDLGLILKESKCNYLVNFNYVNAMSNNQRYFFDMDCDRLNNKLNDNKTFRYSNEYNEEDGVCYEYEEVSVSNNNHLDRIGMLLEFIK